MFEFERALKVIPGGVNSPVRAFKSVEEKPIVVKSAKGSQIIAENGRKFTDFIMSWGAIILGHSHPVVVSELTRAVKDGTSYGLTNKYEIILAEMITDIFNNKNRYEVRLVNSGTEACMSAVRLARAYTKRNIVLKFEGCYHGHSDQFLTAAGSGLATFGIPSSSLPGVPADFTKNTITLPYNSSYDILLETFSKFGDRIACVIVEPIAGNMGVVPSEPEFLLALRNLTQKFSSLLIFDEVISGFRVSLNGSEGYYKLDIEPDIITLGKIIGGGLPVGAFIARSEIMEMLSPLGPVYQAGTLSGNPLGVRSGIAVLKFIKQQKYFYEKLDKLGEQLELTVKESLYEKGIPHTTKRVGSMFSVFFTEKDVKNFDNVKGQDVQMFKRLFKCLFDKNILIPPSPYETWFLSSAHSVEDINKIGKAIKKL